MGTSGPRFLYLHGFASGPNSTKGVKLGERFAARGVTLQRLNLRVPSLERLRFADMMNVVRGALGDSRDRAVVFGSSLGGLDHQGADQNRRRRIPRPQGRYADPDAEVTRGGKARKNKEVATIFHRMRFLC